MATSKYTLLVTHQAQQDIRTAKAYYRTQLAGLEKRFLRAVRQTLVQLQNHPFSAPVRFGEAAAGESPEMQVRGAVVSGFPFIIYYLPEETTRTLTVLSVFHTFQNPAHLQSQP